MKIPYFFLLYLIFFIQINTQAQGLNSLKPSILIVQPIMLQDDNGENPASMNIPKKLINKAYEKAGISFRFLEPIFFKNIAVEIKELPLNTPASIKSPLIFL